MEAARTPLFFLHIPKTGGQTLARRLASAFPAGRAHILDEELGFPEDVAKLQDILKKNDFVESHVRGEILANAGVANILTLTRNPVDQFISNFRHIRREPGNRWSRAAKQLGPARFFDEFGDFFQDHQTRYLLSAFFDFKVEASRRGQLETALSRMMETLDRIRWLAPMESLDEFCDLWQLETGMLIPCTRETVNIAPPDDLNVAALRAAVIARPHLYACDALLHQITLRRFDAYRQKIRAMARDKLAPWNSPDNLMRAFSEGENGIWLLDGWYFPERSGDRQLWWSGPSSASTIRFRRSDRHNFLCFDVTVVNGISQDGITAFDRTANKRIDCRILQGGADRVTYCVPLQGLGVVDDLTFVVSECLPAIMTTEHDDNLVRRSFLASNWSLKQSIE